MFTTRRLVAAIVGLWLVVGGLLGLRHEAQVAHYTSGSGDVFHASRLVGSHTTDRSDIHASSGALDHDACEIAAAGHHARNAAMAPPAIVVARLAQDLPGRPIASVVAARVVFRIAPKTSPPRLG